MSGSEKLTPDCILVFHCYFTSIVHRFPFNELLMFANYFRFNVLLLFTRKRHSYCRQRLPQVKCKAGL